MPWDLSPPGFSLLPAYLDPRSSAPAADYFSRLR